MVVRLLLTLILLVSFPVSSSDREYRGVSWQAHSSDFVVSLSWTPSSAINVYFQQVPNQPIVIKLNAPYLLREAKEASLYLMDSPIAGEGKKTLLEKVSSQQVESLSQKEIRFQVGVDRLINRMAAGAWAVIELESRSGVVHVVELPSIGFAGSFERFNALRNELPPLNWAAARESRTYFAAGSARLSVEQMSKLDNLVGYLQKDSSVAGLTIDAHTDIDGDRLDNLTLSKYRVQAVRKYLIDAGVHESLIIAVRHHGERYPIPGVKAWENRRVVIKLTRRN